MNPEVFCVDCQDFVELNLFSKYHKNHEMKSLSDLLEEKKRTFYKFLELKEQKLNVHMSCFEESDKKWQAIQAQAASIKQTLNDHTTIITAQIEQNRVEGCNVIDTELSKVEQNYMQFKNTFIDKENRKLLVWKRLIEGLNEMSLRAFNFIFPDEVITTPAYTAQLQIALRPAAEAVVGSKHLPNIISRAAPVSVAATLSSSHPPAQPNVNTLRDNMDKPVTPVLPVIPSFIAPVLTVTLSYSEAVSTVTPSFIAPVSAVTPSCSEAVSAVTPSFIVPVRAVTPSCSEAVSTVPPSYRRPMSVVTVPFRAPGIQYHILASSSNSNQNNRNPQKSIKFCESSFRLGRDRPPYSIIQNHKTLYVLFSRLKKLKLFSKHTKQFLRQITFSFVPCGIVCIDEHRYIIDFKQNKLFINWVDDNGEEQVVEIILKSLPTFLSFGRGKKVTITTDKNVQSYDPSSGSLSLLPGTSNIGRVLKSFDLGSMLFTVVHNKGNNKLLYMEDDTVLDEYLLNLDLLQREYLIYVNVNGNVCILNTMEKLITVLNWEFKTLGYVNVKQIDAQQIKDLFFDNQDIIYITSVQSDNVCNILKIPFKS